MEVIAKLKYVRSSSYKIRLVANLIRGKKVNIAMNILLFTKKKSAFLIKKVLMSAIANAKNNYNLNIENLWVSKIYVNNGSLIKRIFPRAKGRINYILKRTSHITVFVSNKENIIKNIKGYI